MDFDEFTQQYRNEPFELVVRISWCWNKNSGPFPQEDGLCHARARFDQAIDTRTGELVGTGLYNWLEWLTPKHRVGHPYGFAFRQGHLYRLLVREALANADRTNARSYYVERIVAADVDEPRLDPFLQFEAGFDDEAMACTLLVEGGPHGWANVFGYRRASVRYYAIADDANAAPQATTGRLIWMEPDRKLSPKTSFDELRTYRVLVRRGVDDHNLLMLVKVVRKVDDPRFEAIRQEYLRPVELACELGTFVLDRHWDWYEGSIDYLGESCDVLLNVEAGSTDATLPLARLEEVCADLPALDARVRAYAADEMLENASDWCEEELMREEFCARMSIASLAVEADGSVEFMFDDGDMFAGHVIVVDMDENGAFTRADIEG